MKYFIIILALGFIGCGYQGPQGIKGDAGIPGVSAPVPTVPAVDSEQEDIDKLVTDENTYRQGLGQTQLTNGLSCTLYTITGGDRIQSSISGHNTLTGVSQVATFLFAGEFNQADSPVSQTMNVLPLALRPIYTNMYLLRCQGQVVVRTTGYYQFDLTSDDGSVLYLDGSKLVDNDNNHGAVMVSGSKYLRRGVHTFRLDYAQSGAGNQALILNANGAQISPKYYTH